MTWRTIRMQADRMILLMKCAAELGNCIMRIIRFNPLKKVEHPEAYTPVLVIIKNKIYTIHSWQEAVQIALYSCCYKTGNMEKIIRDAQKPIKELNGRYLITRDAAVSSDFRKFSPEYYVRVFPTNKDNMKALPRIRTYTTMDCVFYLAKDYASFSDEAFDKAVQKKCDELIEKKGYKKGSGKYLISHINRKVLNEKEKFYVQLDKEFDRKKLIGDIEISSEQEVFLKEYMCEAVKLLTHGREQIEHEKVFAYGMVWVARNHYKSKKYWPFFDEEVGFHVHGRERAILNEKFREIMKNYGKPYYEDSSNSLHNYCMHNFVCDRCADQLFDYVFDFWRIDLSYSLENCRDDNGNDLFDILVDEIEHNDLNSVNDVMLHTTMAMQMNPRGCKNRFRRILKMIDQSFWNDADYSSSTNRLSVLFTRWRNNPGGNFLKEFNRTSVSRKGTHGEKLLTSPTILFSPSSESFSLLLPKQILRQCREDETPQWQISINGIYRTGIRPILIQGKISLFTEETGITLNSDTLFENIEIVLASEKREYSRTVIASSDIRFFNTRNRCIEANRDYISKDVYLAFARKDAELQYVNGRFADCIRTYPAYDIYRLDPEEGDVLILPDRHAVSVGRVLDEGIVGNSRIRGVYAIHNENEFEITADRERLFFKVTKRRLKGTFIRISESGNKVYFGNVEDRPYIEFKLTDAAEDTYGYFLDLHDYINGNGIYEIELGIPGSPVRKYRVCYIRRFSYMFNKAAYIFDETGTITFPAFLDVVTDDSWKIDEKDKKLIFRFDEHSNEKNTHVRDRKLYVDYQLNTQTIALRFDLPVFYWKYRKEEEWMFRKPDEITIRDLPANIYISGDLNLSKAVLKAEEYGDLDIPDVNANYDSKNNLFYFRTVDFIENLNREKVYRFFDIEADGRTERFLQIACRSIVASRSITGDFRKKIIFGNYEIYGNNDYMVTIRCGGETVEEDIPVKKGRFEVTCDVHEDTYEIILYELEEDESGFDSIAYEIDRYDLKLTDVRNLVGKDLRISYVRDINQKYAPLWLNRQYVIRDLHRLNYESDINETVELYSWKYDVYEDISVLSECEYYSGVLGALSENGVFTKVGPVLAIFDNPEDMSEALITHIEDDECSPLLYDTLRKKIHVDDSGFSRYERSKLTVLDDDLYKIKVLVKPGS